ncbi:hypothetical protein AB0O00_40255, partial [Kitasatospora sp. NPDC093558]
AGGESASTGAVAGAGAVEEEPTATERTTTAHPKSGHTPHTTPRPSPAGAPTPPPGRAQPPATPPTLGPGSICDQAERIGRWPADSEQARLCRSIYG